jgi:CIC family chloride channel protein
MVFLAAVIGVATGLSVAGVQSLVMLTQRGLMGFAAERRIMLPEHASFLRIFLSLAASAVLLTALGILIKRYSSRQPIDAVEANALRGGTMTWFDAVAVVVPILASAGFGASVGIEAAVTQLGAVMASQFGRSLGRPRSDLRILVGAGAAAAIAAAYRAPIAGMLYAYELVLGTYSKRTLAPVGIAALAGVLTIWVLTGQAKPFQLETGSHVTWPDYLLALVIGFLAAVLGIAVMLLVSVFERLAKAMPGGETGSRLVVALLMTILSIRYPAVLGSGHSAIERASNGDIAGRAALGLLGAKSLASAACLGSGFRGGLFSASLMIGALLGQVVAWVIPMLPGGAQVVPELCAIIGMAAVGASIIGSPLAMIFLVLETTGDFDATVVVAIGAVTAAFLTDRLFGYSFATWRFQQRGLAIDGGQEISRLQSTTIAEVIRPPARSIAATAGITEVVHAVSSAGGRGTAVYGLDGRFLGLVDPSLVEIATADGGPLPVVASDLIYATTPAITPRTTLAEITALLRADDRPTLAVLDPADPRKLVGCVRARDAFAMASHLSDMQRREELGIPRA